ncbi:MAG: T9SS type A sorting domain-containing protein [Candidatus Desantisbacteria bacterium]
MNIRRIGILGLMAMMGVFWGYNCVDAAITGVTDNTSGLTKYLGEKIEFQMTTDATATATVVLTASEIRSVKKIIAGGAFDLNGLWWNQYDIGSCYVGGKVEVFVVNKNNGNGTWSTFAISDYDTPKDLFSAINTISFGTSTYGSVTYEPTTDKVVFRAASNYEIGLREYCDDGYKTPLFTQLKLPVVSVNMTAYTPKKYSGIYEVPITEAIGTWTVYGFAVDGLGTTSMKGSMTITMDGSQAIPIEKSKIIGLRVEPSPSKQFFNSLLKQMHVQMVVATIDKELGDFNIVSGDTCFTLVASSSSTIGTGTRVIIWNDYIRDENNTVVFDYGHVWSTITTTSGTITFSDADLCFGSATGTYSTAVLRMKNFHVAIGTFTTKGRASFNLGNEPQSISLYDDGQNIHCDARGRDGIFSNTYVVPDEIDIRAVAIIGHFMDERGYRVPNDGYPFEDTDFSNDIKVNICTIPPEVGILGANPSTFNPAEGKNCDIKYNLRKGTNVNVRVIINKTTSGDGEIVKDLGTKRATLWDNVCSWDGKDEQGRLVPDGRYYYHVIATDEAGNKSENIVNYGVIVVTYVRIAIKELVVSVPQALPGEGINRVTIRAVVSLDGTPEQLKNLNFNVANSSDVYNRPHALFDLAIYDNSMNKMQKIGYDIVDSTGAPYDSDPFPKGRPNYLTPPADEKNWLVNAGTSSNLEDTGDGNATNDWDTLVPFNKANPVDINEQHYESEFAVIMSYYSNSPFKNGTFFVKGFVGLDSADWKFIGYDDLGKEKWHCSPSGKHYGVQSKFVEQRFEVWEAESSHNTDNRPPVVYESYPSNGAVVSPSDINSGGDGIWVTVKDTGIGVEFRSSYISLLDPDKEEVVGVRTSNAIDILRLIIDKDKYPNGLEKPGAYTIEITVRDKNNNVTEVTRGFTVLDKLGPDITVLSPLQEGSVYYERFGSITLSARISEEERGKSGVDWGSSRITLVKNGTDIDIRHKDSIQQTDANQGVLTYSLPQGFLTTGTYAMKVLAWDSKGNPASKEVSFIVLRGIEIPFHHPEIGTVSTLVFQPNTLMSFGNGSPTVVSTQTITLQQAAIDQATIDKDALSGYTLFGSPVSVLIGTRSAFGATFDKDVQLTIYYTGNENDLVLYGYGTKWVYIAGAPKGMYTIESGKPLYSTYTLAYITPQKWKVMSGTSSEWGSLKNKDWMELVGTITTTAGTPIPNGSITIGIIKDYPSPVTGYKILSPVVAFDFNGDKVINFNAPVTIWIHYTKPLPSDAKEGGLTVFGCDKDNQWVKITGNLSTDGNYISFNTNYTYKSYAVMYTTSEVVQTGDETIEQNVWCYPNPAKGGKVNFRYYLPENDVEVTVKIYTLLGDLVWERSKIEVSAGIHDDFDWKCQNSSSEPVASGVYIYRLTIKPKSGSAAKTVTKKLIVVQ